MLWHVRHLDSALVARDAAVRLVELWPTLDHVLLTALYSSIVVHYARIFADSRSGRTYPAKRLRGELGFDPQIHTMLLAVRGKLAAHIDKDAATGRSTLEGHTIATDTWRITVLSALVFHSTGLVGPLNLETAQRVRVHTESVALHLYQAMREDATQLANLAGSNPEALVEALQRAGATLVDHGNVTGKIGPSGHIQVPPVPPIAPKSPVPSVAPESHVFRHAYLKIFLKRVVKVPGADSAAEVVLNANLSDDETVQLHLIFAPHVALGAAVQPAPSAAAPAVGPASGEYKVNVESEALVNLATDQSGTSMS